jgi:nucleotide-binding universal stress UspA family protein
LSGKRFRKSERRLKMYERILVPLDGSELAEVALPYAEELAARLGSNITLLNVSESAEDQYRHMHQFYMQKMVENAKQGTERKLRKPVTKRIKVDSAVLVGHPAEGVVDYAHKEKIGLIVMSTHGRTGIRRWAIGSVAYKVVKAASQPIVIIRAKGVRPDMREKDILRKVLVALDGSKESEAVIPYVAELASRLKLKVTFLRVLTPEWLVTSETRLREIESLRASAQDYIENMAARFKRKGIAAKAEYREAMPPKGAADEIMKLADAMKADMVAMSTRGRSEFEETPGEWVLSLGSVAEEMVHTGNRPLLLVRPKTVTK